MKFTIINGVGPSSKSTYVYCEDTGITNILHNRSKMNIDTATGTIDIQRDYRDSSDEVKRNLVESEYGTPATPQRFSRPACGDSVVRSLPKPIRRKPTTRPGSGVVTKFDVKRGFGFIASANSHERYFFHITSVKELDDMGYSYKPKMGDIFAFEIVENPERGPVAVGLERIIDGKRRTWN